MLSRFGGWAVIGVWPGEWIGGGGGALVPCAWTEATQAESTQAANTLFIPS
jgi:hypothetical protein